MTIRAKKSLGQNFLRAPLLLKKIVDAGMVSAEDTVLEVGPGEGTLTTVLLSRSARVIAVEKDDRLIPVLQKKFSEEIAAGQLTLVHEDILKCDLTHWKLPARFESRSESGGEIGNWKLIANIPYYLTGAILKKFLGGKCQPKSAVLLIQKEVAERIVARDGKESILSISIKVYGEPRIVGKVPRGAFTPAPNVDSAIISIENISKKFFKGISEEEFFALVRRGFKSKRKTLVNNLGIEKSAAEKILSECGIEPRVRPENLSPKEWRILALLIQKH